MGRGRRLAAAASLLATAGGFAWIGLGNGIGWVHWHALAFAAALGAASFGLTRKSVLSQVVSRGLAWVVFAPAALVVAAELLKGRLMEPGVTAMAITTGLALFLSHPMLKTPEARAAFAPSKFRRSFLAACTTSVTVGLVLGMAAYELFWFGASPGGLALGALSASILASAFGVLRMRGWGIALATLNALVSLVAGGLVGGGAGLAIGATALPGVLLLLPIVLAKLGLGETDRAPEQVRVATEISRPERIRVEVTEEARLLEDESQAEARVARVA